LVEGGMGSIGRFPRPAVPRLTERSASPRRPRLGVVLL
jgi:hypothetical protein